MKRPATIDSAKEEVKSLLGKFVSVKLNRGRNRIKNYTGVLSEVHSNVFVVTLYNDIFDRLSCSYTDIVCGEIVLKENKRQPV